MKLVILTTAITRGDFHKMSIGDLYKANVFDSFSHSDIHHIINIDFPDRLSNEYSIKDTESLLISIIPKEVNVTFTYNTYPSFLGAYTNVVNKAIELKLNNSDNIFWWLEDDWKYEEKGYDIFKIFKMFIKYDNVAMNAVKNSPLGSFRGGPIMTGSFFNNYFNITNVSDKISDPELQVRSWIRGFKCRKIKKQIVREIIDEKDKEVDLIVINIGNAKRPRKRDYDLILFKDTSSFNPKIKLNRYIINIDTNSIKYSSYDIEEDKYNFISIKSNELSKIFNKDTIKHLYINPPCLSDIGRAFAESHGLNKWEKSNNTTTYQ